MTKCLFVLRYFKIYSFIAIIISLLVCFCSSALAASGSVKVVSTTVAANRKSVSVNVDYVVNTDGQPAPSVSYNTNGCYKECFSPTLDTQDSCNTFRYAYFKKTSALQGTFVSPRSVERIWCPYGYDNLGALLRERDILTIPANYTGDNIVTTEYYLQDVAGYGCQKYYGQIYSCNTSSPHPGYKGVIASASVKLKLCDNKQTFCCIDADNDGYFSVDAGCAGGDDCDDNDPTVNPGATDGCCPKILSFSGENKIIDLSVGGNVAFSFEVHQDYDSATITIDGNKIAGTSWNGMLGGKRASVGTHSAMLSVKKDDCIVTATVPVKVEVEPKDNCKLKVTIGSSVNVASGELSDSLNLFALPGSGPVLDLTLRYASLASHRGPLGLGWSHNFERDLRINAFGEAIVRTESGSDKLYTPEGSSFMSRPGDSAILTREGDGSFARTLKDGTQERFSIDGQLVSIVDRNGNALNLVYAAGLLQTVSDSTGRSITFTYDGNGHLTSISDPAGQTYTLEIGESLASVTFPDGGEWRYSYAANAFLTAKTDPLGNLTTYAYDDQSRVVSSADPEGRSRTITYPTAIETVRTTTFTEKDGGIWQYTYDTAAGDLLAKTDPTGNVTSYTYDANHNQMSKTDASGTATSTYDAAGNLTTSTDVAGQTTSYTYNAYGQVTSITAPDGGVMRYDHDERGNLIGSMDASGATTRYAYDSAGRTISVTAPDGGITRMGYDAQGNLTSVTSPDGVIQRLEYDASGRVIKQIDPQGGVSTFEYDVRGNLVKSIDPLGNVSTVIYDANGNKTSATDANGNTTRFEINAQGKVVKSIDAAGFATTFAYGGSAGCSSCSGGVDKLTSLTDANGNVTTFAYDPLGRPVEESDPLGYKTLHSYDAKGNLTARTDANGNTIRYSYDLLGRLVKKLYPDNSEETYSYDAKGNILTAANPAASYVFAYDASSRVTSVSDGNGRAIGYEYDSAGRKTKMVAPDGKILRYDYDSAGRLKELRNGGNFAFAYDTLGRRASVTYPNGAVAGYAYDNGGRLTSLDHSNASGRIVAQSAYTLDKVGNRLSKATEAETLRYGYDALYRLLAADRVREHGGHDDRDNDDHNDKYRREDDHHDNDQDHRAGESYRYDPVGNRLSGPKPAKHQIAAIHDAANRLLEDRHYRYSYDNNGNLIAKIDKGDDEHHESWSYRYDFENRLIEAVKLDKHDPVTVCYAYDPFGRRVEKRVTERDDGKLKTKITRYFYDNEDILYETDEKGKISNRYIHGPGIDEPLALIQGKETYYYHADGLGSIVALTDKSGKVVQDYQYDSFGNLKDQKNRIKQPYAYTGREYDKETGMYYYRARYYDAEAGRFLSKDPIGFSGGDVALWNYVGNNVINKIDPSGLYGYDIHYEFTYLLSLNSGIPENLSKNIAESNNRVDTNFWTNPTLIVNGAWLTGLPFHFQTKQYASVGLMQAIESGNANDFGKFLHMWQDTYSHGAYGFPFGHVLTTNPDNYDYDSGRDFEMIETTRYWLSAFKNKLCGGFK